MCDMIQFYNTVQCDVTTANLQWSTVMKNFKIQWNASKEWITEDEPEVPKITKTLPIIKWAKAFQDYLNQCIGNFNIPLSYIIQDEPNPLAAISTSRHIHHLQLDSLTLLNMDPLKHN